MKLFELQREKLLSVNMDEDNVTEMLLNVEKVTLFHVINGSVVDVSN